jgi:hypothetical protein
MEAARRSCFRDGQELHVDFVAPMDTFPPPNSESPSVEFLHRHGKQHLAGALHHWCHVRVIVA